MKICKFIKTQTGINNIHDPSRPTFYRGAQSIVLQAVEAIEEGGLRIVINYRCCGKLTGFVCELQY